MSSMKTSTPSTSRNSTGDTEREPLVEVPSHGRDEGGVHRRVPVQWNLPKPTGGILQGENARVCQPRQDVLNGGQDIPLPLYCGVQAFRRSTQILTSPFFFGTRTMGAHHSVGSLTSSMTPHCSILSSSALTLGKRGADTRLAVLTL